MRAEIFFMKRMEKQMFANYKGGVCRDAMAFVITAPVPFPDLFWFAHVLDQKNVVWNVAAQFLKAGFHNRYYVATAQGMMALSVPIKGGREQSISLGNTTISYDENWQKKHWRTIVSAYNRAPFFEHYAPSLEHIFTRQKLLLADFNLETVHWLKAALQLTFKEASAGEHLKPEKEKNVDLRFLKPNKKIVSDAFPAYHQVFADRQPFLPDLSMLDLLFMEGPYAAQWISDHKKAVLESVRY